MTGRRSPWPLLWLLTVATVAPIAVQAAAWLGWRTVLCGVAVASGMLLPLAWAARWASRRDDP